MEILTRIIDTLFAEIPSMVWLVVFCVVLNTYLTSIIIDRLEKAIETKKGKEIKFFDYKKIWIAFIWSLVFTVFLILSKIITFQECFIYFFLIIGLSTFLYEAFLKRFLYKKEVENNG